MSTVFLPAWRSTVAEHAASLRGATIGEIATHVARCRAAVDGLPQGDDRNARAAFDQWLTATAATLALERAGWTIEAPPGAPVGTLG